MACLDAYGQSLSPNTAPAGYLCPKCKVPTQWHVKLRLFFPYYLLHLFVVVCLVLFVCCLFVQDPLLPLPNMVSPVAGRLRQVLQAFSWARATVGPMPTAVSLNTVVSLNSVLYNNYATLYVLVNVQAARRYRI